MTEKNVANSAENPGKMSHRLIDADELFSTLSDFRQSEYSMGNYSTAYGLSIAKTLCRNSLTIDAVPVVHGRWEPRQDVIGFVRCSVCHDCNIYDDWADGKKWNYCPNCGATMDLEE